MAGPRIYSFTEFGVVTAKWRFVRAGVEGGGLAWCMPTAGAVRREVAMGRGREQWRGIVALGLVLGVSGPEGGRVQVCVSTVSTGASTGIHRI